MVEPLFSTRFQPPPSARRSRGEAAATRLRRDILVGRYDIAPEAAFARLVDASPRHNVKVRQLAEELGLSRQDPYDGGPVPADGTGCSPPPARLTPAGLGHHADVSRGRLVINP